MDDSISASVELGQLEDDGAQLSFRFTIDSKGNEDVEVYATARDSRRKGVLFLFSMDQLSQLEDIVAKARNAKQQLLYSNQQRATAQPEIIEAMLVTDDENEPRALYEAAKKSNQSGNKTATIAILKQIIQVYPDSLYAKKASKSLNKHLDS